MIPPSCDIEKMSALDWPHVDSPQDGLLRGFSRLWQVVRLAGELRDGGRAVEAGAPPLLY